MSLSGDDHRQKYADHSGSGAGARGALAHAVTNSAAPRMVENPFLTVQVKSIAYKVAKRIGGQAEFTWMTRRFGDLPRRHEIYDDRPVERRLCREFPISVHNGTALPM